MFSPDFSDAEYIIVMCGLAWLFGELSVSVTEDELGQSFRREDLANEAANCQVNLETSLSVLPFHLPIHIDYVVALGLAVRRSYYSY